MNIGNIVGTSLGIKLVNGKIKPKYGRGAIIGMIIMVLIFIAFCCGLIYGLITIDFELIFASICGTFGFGGLCKNQVIII